MYSLGDNPQAQFLPQNDCSEGGLDWWIGMVAPAMIESAVLTQRKGASMASQAGRRVILDIFQYF